MNSYSVVALNEHGSVYLDDILIVQQELNDVSVYKIVTNKMPDLNNTKIVHRKVLSVKY